MRISDLAFSEVGALLLLLLMTSLFPSCKTAQGTTDNAMKSYTYTDAMSNRYRVSNDSLTYEPIKPALSSSGVADGGEPKLIHLDALQLKELSQLLEALPDDKANHLSMRLMGCGTLSITSGEHSETFFIRQGSADRTALEEKLIELLK